MSTSLSSPLVSVVVPTYNRTDCIEWTIDSALGQTHQKLEILVVDDGSNDDTRQLIERRYGADARVRYIYQENRGVSAARNTGLQNAQGEFIALLDSDDIWMPWKLELQLACLELLPEAGMIWTDMEAVGPDGEMHNPRYLRTMYSAYQWFTFEQLFSESHPLPAISATLPEHERGARVYAGDIFSQMIMGNLVHTSTVLLRRERLQQVRGFSEELRHSGEDYDFHLRTCRAGPVAFVDVASIKYVKGRSDQLTRPAYAIHMARNFLRTLAPILAQDRDRIHLPPHMIAFVLSDAHGWIGEVALDIGEGAEARRHLLQSLRYRPWQPRKAGLLLASLFPARFSRRLRMAYRQARGQLPGRAVS
jgi:glycosyltransferase involved in cell wall biosynthesis